MGHWNNLSNRIVGRSGKLRSTEIRSLLFCPAICNFPPGLVFLQICKKITPVSHVLVTSSLDN